MKKIEVALVDANELEMWPFVPMNSKLWKLDYARDICRLVSAIEKSEANTGIEIIELDAIMGWLFDIAIAYDGLVRFTTVLRTDQVSSTLNYLADMKYRQSPLFNSPANLDEHAKTAYVTLLKNARPIRERYPRLLKAMQWTACLSEGEAASCLWAYMQGYGYSTEATNHFGGTRRVVERAVQNRSIIPRTLPLPR